MKRDQILASLRERILAFATLRVSKEHAEDLTQDVLVVLHEKYPHVVELTHSTPAPTIEHALYPVWANRPEDPIDVLDNEGPAGLTWDALADTGEGKDAKDEVDGGNGRVEQTLLDTLIAKHDPDHAGCTV